MESEQVRRPGGPLTVTAVVIAAAALCCAIATLVLHARNAAALGDAAELYLADVWVAVLVPPVGAYLIAQGHRLLGGVLLSTALLALGGVAGTAATFLIAVRGATGAFPGTLAWLATWTWTPYLLLPTMVPLLFPDGRPASRRWSAVAWMLGGAVALITLLSAFAPGPLEPFPLVTNPLGGPQWVLTILSALIPAVVVLGTPLGLVSVFFRWRRASPATRQHVSWLLAALTLLVATVLLGDRLPYPWSDVVVAVGFTAVMAAVATAVTAERTAADLQHSREQLIVARETERMRLHRDLHDGLGPQLAGMALHLHAIGNSVEDPALRSHLAQAEVGMRETVAEVRRIVEDLRPPALDELGLVGALQERARALSADGGLRVSVEATRGLGNLPPAVEVAAYRITAEALLNAVRHASATRCGIRLGHDGQQLHIEIVDDGTGLVAPRPGGVGLASMRARAEELGGRLTIGARRGGGASVEAWLPLAAP